MSSTSIWLIDRVSRWECLAKRLIDQVGGAVGVTGKGSDGSDGGLVAKKGRVGDREVGDGADDGTLAR